MLGIDLVMVACIWKWSYSYEAMDAILGYAYRKFLTLRNCFTVLEHDGSTGIQCGKHENNHN